MVFRFYDLTTDILVSLQFDCARRLVVIEQMVSYYVWFLSKRRNATDWTIIIRASEIFCGPNNSGLPFSYARLAKIHHYRIAPVLEFDLYKKKRATGNFVRLKYFIDCEKKLNFVKNHRLFYSYYLQLFILQLGKKVRL